MSQINKHQNASIRSRNFYQIRITLLCYNSYIRHSRINRLNRKTVYMSIDCSIHTIIMFCFLDSQLILASILFFSLVNKKKLAFLMLKNSSQIIIRSKRGKILAILQEMHSKIMIFSVSIIQFDFKNFFKKRIF